MSYKSLRAKLIEKGSSLNKWAISRGYSPRSVYAAAEGSRKGPKAIEIMEQLNKEIL